MELHVAGKSPAWATPMINCATMSSQKLGAIAIPNIAAEEAIVKTLSAIREPSRSENQALGIWKMAYVQKKAPMNQPDSLKVSPSSSRIALSATPVALRQRYARAPANVIQARAR